MKRQLFQAAVSTFSGNPYPELAFVNKLGFALYEPYLESYINGLIAKIAPATYFDKRPCKINVLVTNQDTQDVFVLSNGTINITTGLLSLLHSEDELVAVLAHEIAHFVLDHNMDGHISVPNKDNAKIVGKVLNEDKDDQHDWKSNASGSFSSQRIEDLNSETTYIGLGVVRSHAQEIKADELACKVLKIFGYDENALATALNRLANNSFEERDESIYYSSYTHPKVYDRIKGCGTPSDRRDPEFEKKISLAITAQAWNKFNSRRYFQSLYLVNQNIDLGVATSEDYLLKAKCLLVVGDSPSSATEVLDLIDKAQTVGQRYPIATYKLAILANYRLDNCEKAVEMLEDYSKKLNELDPEGLKAKTLEKFIGAPIETEVNWTRQMLEKFGGKL